MRGGQRRRSSTAPAAVGWQQDECEIGENTSVATTISGNGSHFGDVDGGMNFDKARKGFGDICGENAGRTRGELWAGSCGGDEEWRGGEVNADG
jgi:hypothetical protein